MTLALAGLAVAAACLAGCQQQADPETTRATRGPKRIVTGDFDGDGVSDAAVSGWNSALVLVLFGGSGEIRTGTASTTPDGTGNAWGLLSADLNEDGRDDLIVADGDGPRLTLFLSTDPSTEETR